MRMYFFVMYNLSGIQKGIQAGHAALEYAHKYKNDKRYIDFIENHKTFIILDGGGSNDILSREKELESFAVDFVSFQEPDLNNSVSAIAFLVDENVYSYKEEPISCWGGNQTPESFECRFFKYLRSFKLASN